MYWDLSEFELKNGESVKIKLILCPDEYFKDKIVSLLRHKGGIWVWQIDRSLSMKLDDLETRYHVGFLNDRPIANLMIVEYNKVGILGHVFTKPEYRRNGVCTAILHETLSLFKKRGGSILYLSTRSNSPAYRIYRKHGFQEVLEGSGLMSLRFFPNVEKNLFISNDVNIVSLQWQHWPMLMALCSFPSGDYLRNLSFGHFGISTFYGNFLEFKKRAESYSENFHCKVLQTSLGVVVGYVMVIPNSLWRGDVNIMELFLHPNFSNYGPSLLKSLPFIPKKTQCFVDSMAEEKMNILRECGYRFESTFKKQIRKNSRLLDVHVFSKNN